MLLGNTAAFCRFGALVGVARLLTKGNSTLLRRMGSRLSRGAGSLSGCSTAPGFKKALYNRIHAQERRLRPPGDRRRHSHSHLLIVTNQLRRADRALCYVGRKKFSSIVASSLRGAHAPLGRAEALAHLFSGEAANARAVPGFASAMEARIPSLLWRNQFAAHFASSRQALLHRSGRRAMGAFCKNQTVLLKRRNPQTLR